MGHRNSESEDSDEEKVVRKLPNLRAPITINLKKIILNVSDTQYNVVSQVGRSFGYRIQRDPEAGDWDVFFTDYDVAVELLFKMKPFQKINHFPGMQTVSRKNLLAINLKRMQSKFQQQYDFVPQTWLLPSEYSEFRGYYESVQKGKARTYIVKPQAMSQGIGIFLTRNIQHVQTGERLVVQRYIKSPYLIDGLKFDLRIYVLIAGSNPFRIYIYEEGLVRFATEAYRVPGADNLDDLCCHLTNYAINKYSQKFVFNTSEKKTDVGHKRSLTSVYKYLEQKGEDVVRLKQDIDQIIVKTMLSGQQEIEYHYNACQPDNLLNNMCFEILGFDILLTKCMKPWLIEVNHRPSFETDSPFDEHVKKGLLRDSFTLMNINVPEKNRICQKLKDKSEQRIYKKQTKLDTKQRQKLFEEAQADRNDYQDQHLGGYRKLFPAKGYEDIQRFNKSSGIIKNLKQRHKEINDKKKAQPDKPDKVDKLNKQDKDKEDRSDRADRVEKVDRVEREKGNRIQQRSTDSSREMSVKPKKMSGRLDKESVYQKNFRIRLQKDKPQRQKSREREKELRRLMQMKMGAGSFLVPKTYSLFNGEEAAPKVRLNLLPRHE